MVGAALLPRLKPVEAGVVAVPRENPVEFVVVVGATQVWPNVEVREVEAVLGTRLNPEGGGGAALPSEIAVCGVEAVVAAIVKPVPVEVMGVVVRGVILTPPRVKAVLGGGPPKVVLGLVDAALAGVEPPRENAVVVAAAAAACGAPKFELPGVEVAVALPSPPPEKLVAPNPDVAVVPPPTPKFKPPGVAVESAPKDVPPD